MQLLNDIYGNTLDGVRLDQSNVHFNKRLLMPYFPSDCQKCGNYLGDRELTKHEKAFQAGATHFDVKCPKCKKVVYSIDVVYRAYFDVK